MRSRQVLVAVVLAFFGATLSPIPAQTFEPETLELTGTVRDFRRSHPDMQFRIRFDPGIVEPLLGDDGKPVYTTSRTSTATTNGKEFFDQWYRDVEGVNLRQPLTIPLTNSAANPGIFTFDSNSFFPIDGQLFGNEGMFHNFYFTFELHTRFTYRGGEVFNFRGDDDVFVFVNGHLVIDIGGVHGPIGRSVNLDSVAESIGIEVGGVYDLDFFFAERFCCGSNFRMQTSILLEQPPEDPCGDGTLDPGEQCDDGNTEDGDGCSATCEIEGLPPVALCQDPTLFTDPGTCLAPASIDAGSFDPEGGELTLVQAPAGPFGPGTTEATLEATDPTGASAACNASVSVVDREPPQVSCNAPALAEGGGGPLTFTAISGDNCQPPSTVTLEVLDATCRNDDLDDDGVPDDVDECPGSDVSDELVIAECATGADNVLFPSGCTFSDLIFNCAEDAANHGDFVSCVAHLTNTWRDDRLITGREKGAIQRCAARAPIPPGSTGNSLRSILGSGTAEPGETACPATVEGETVTFPEVPGIGELAWTVTATDGFGNTTTEDCTVFLQNPDTPLPNLPPVADGGEGALVLRGQTVQLDGSASADLNGDDLTFVWKLTAPAGSAAALSDPASSTPTFVTDTAGVYRAELVVSDGLADSGPDAVEILAFNTRPAADAGADSTARFGDTVTFDGVASADPDGDPLTFSWSLAFQPAGSTAVLSDPVAVTPTLTVDRRGTYVAHLTVSDGALSSLVDAVILTVPNAPPVADAGADQEISVFDTVQLDGSGSSDLEGDPLSFQWAFSSVPPGSTAELSDPNVPDPTFAADVAGTYVVQLVVSDGRDASAPDTVQIVTVNTPPVANAGPDQTAFLNDVVTLDGTGSFDVDGDPLSFQWTVTNRPAGSTASLSDPTSPQPTIQVDVRGVYTFELVVDDGQRTSRLADSVRVDVVNRPPTADAGPDQTVGLGDTVLLDGSGSSDADGDPLTFAWSFVSVPAGSTAVLSSPTSSRPSFVADTRGDYVVQLVVNDGFEASAPDTVTLTVPNEPPRADAGPDQNVFVTDTVFLDGSGSFDGDGDPLTFAWSFTSRPAGSSAVLSDPTAIAPTFEADAPGTYVVELVVDDGFEASAPDSVTITTQNSPPVADAGPDQEVEVGDTVQLDGSGSSDVDGDPLSFAWSFVSVPPGSTATLSDPTAVNPTFVVDQGGAYLLELVVNDGELDSAPDRVSIATGNVAPVADAGPDQTAFVGDVVQLDGSGSFDANTDPLSFAWSFVSVPAGSLATLSDPSAVDPTFEVDVFGEYVVELVVNDGEFDSAPDTVTITTENSRPVADAGPDQLVIPGTPVDLDGSGSFDVDDDPLTFSWSLTTVPAGSTATLSDPTVADPFFVADVVGTYVAQLLVNDGELDSLPDTVMVEVSDDVATVPDVVGLDQVDAEAAIVAEGLVVGDVTPAPSNTVPAGQVIEQDPVGGTVVLGGSVVDLVVSVGPNPAPRLRASFDRDPPIYAAGEPVELTILADDNDGPPIVTVALDGVLVPSTLPITALDTSGLSPGTSHQVLVTATDVVGTTVEERLVFTIADGSDTTAPQVSLTAPAEDSVIRSAVDVIGTATDAHLVGYDLAYAQVGTDDFVVFDEATSSITEGVLGTLDGTLLPNGMYEIRLRAFDATQVSSVTRVVRVDGERKIGNFTVSFNDVVLPLAGIPITITRTYDSRIKTREDFGVGWTLGVAQGEYSNNRTPGLGWEILPSGGPISLPCQNVSETLNHVTEARLSDAEAFFFRLTLTNPAPTTGGCFAIARFVPLPGNLSASLEIPGNQDVLFLNATNEVLDVDTLEVYEPTDVRLTTPDGRIVELDLSQGVTSARDSNGNAIVLGPGGITHTGGAGIDFQRDALGRITRITRPDGQFLAYSYDEFGDLVQVVDAQGATTEFSYDSDHVLTGIVDARGVPLVRNEYDSDGRLIATTDADGNRTEFEHDLAGNREIYRDRLGNVQIFEYDVDGNVTSRTDELGNTSLFGYDADGNLTLETDPLGNTATRTYDADGNILTEIDPLGNTVTKTYAPRGLPLTETDALGNTTNHTYDADGNRLSTTDPLGAETTFSHDAAGNLVSTTDPLGFVTTQTFNSDGREVSATDAEGNTVTTSYNANGDISSETRERTVGGTVTSETRSFAYDAEGRVVARTDRTGATTRTEYDGAGLITAQIDALGNRVELDYNFHGKLAEVRYPDGATETFEYDAEGRKIASTDRAGRRTQFVRDAVGRITSTIHPDGSVEAVSYDAAGRKVSETDANGNTTAFAYDAAGRLISVTDPLGGVTAFTYDAAGRKVAETDANGHTTTFEYDANGNLVRQVFADGSETMFAYDAVGNKTSETDQAGNTTTFAYDGLGRLVQITDALGGVTRYGYDEAGNRTSITDANGHTTRFELDGEGRETLRILPGGQQTVREYDAAGNLVRTVDANGQEILFDYDSEQRLIRRTLPGGATEDFTYTPTGQVSTVTDSQGVTRFTYDARDRLIRRENPDGSFLAHIYDATGNQLSVETPTGVTTFTYDALNRMAATRGPGGGLTTYTYDAVGNLASVVSPNGTRAVYAYDELNRLVRLENLRPDNTVIASYDYTLGPAGNRIHVVENTGRVVDYSYDALLRLTQEVVSGTDSTMRSYTYDAVGNRLTRTIDGVTTSYTYDVNDRLLSEGGAVYTHDANGNVLSRTEAGVTTTYAYDSLDRLIQVQEAGNVIDFAYDFEGLRTSRTVNGVETRFLVDANREHAQVLEERDGAGALTTSYVHGLDLIQQDRGGDISYYHYDGLGSVRALTDGTQSITDTYTYEAFGEILDSTGSTPNDYLFTGEQFDPNVGFYYLRARYYDPTVGRFTTADTFPPNLFDPETLHRYVYVVNNPVNMIDPSGQFATVAGLSATVSITQMLSTIQPALIKGTIILGGIEIFYRPGFELRNLGLEMLHLANNPESWEAGMEVHQNGLRLIRLGSFFIKTTDEILGTVDTVRTIGDLGLGLVKFAEAIRPPSGSLTFRGTRSFGGFGKWAGLTEVQGIDLFLKIENGPSTTFIRGLNPDVKDFTEAVRVGLRWLNDLNSVCTDLEFACSGFGLPTLLGP